MSKKQFGKASLIIFALLFFWAYRQWGLDAYLSLQNLRDHQTFFQDYYTAHPFQVIAIFLLIYVVSTAISLPGATVLTLAGGAVFGLVQGTLLVSIASTTGATLAFLGSRFLFSDLVQKHFKEKLVQINREIKKQGAFYLFTLRLVPVFPFFLINLVMGLTQIRTLTFFLVSQIGMLPGTVVYVNAGTQLAQISSAKDILSIELLVSFALIGVLPLFSRFFLGWYKSRKYFRRFKKPRHFDYNLIVIGAGSAGLVSAYIASAVRAKVALIEKHKMGGDCLNTGCVPSKALIRSAKILNLFKRASEFGLEVPEFSFDFSKVMERVKRVIQEIEPHDSVERYRSLGVECISGEAKVLSPYEVQVADRTVTAKNLVLATGASPFVPPIPGLKESNFFTSDSIWDLRELPKRLLVLGGGPIGCELAQCFTRFGSQVSLIEMAPRIMVREDEEVSEFITSRFRAEGMNVLTSHRALKVEGNALICEYREQEVSIPFDAILVALGRKANVLGFGLENLEVEIAQNGTVAVDEYLRTTRYPSIYACGDVAGPYQFTHTASHQAWFVAVNALFSPFKKFPVDYSIIPWCTFTDPEIARVGLNEQEAKERGIEYQSSIYHLSDLDRAIAEGEAHGFVKVLTPPGKDRVLGVTIVGDHAGDIIAEYVAAMKQGFGLNKILGTIHIYPTLAEANKYAAGVWKKNNAPEGTLKVLKHYHQWRRG